MTTITIPRETFDQMQMALDGLLRQHNSLLADCDKLGGDAVTRAQAALSAAKAVQPHTSGDYALGYAEGFNDACKPAAKEVQPQAQVDGLKEKTE